VCAKNAGKIDPADAEIASPRKSWLQTQAVLGKDDLATPANVTMGIVKKRLSTRRLRSRAQGTRVRESTVSVSLGTATGEVWRAWRGRRLSHSGQRDGWQGECETASTLSAERDRPTRPAGCRLQGGGRRVGMGVERDGPLEGWPARGRQGESEGGRAEEVMKKARVVRIQRGK
jgi:hypothetical protein